MDTEYDPTQAKFCASLLWFVCRISENEECNVPPEITSPLDGSSKTGILVRPAVVEYLTTGIMYFKVASNIYERPFKSFWDLLHYLSKNGIYAVNEKEETITDKDLQEKHPFKMQAHINMMDAILQAYIESTTTVQNFINSIKKFSSFNASREMPFDIEDAAVLWLNKLNATNTTKYLLKQNSPLPSPQDVSSGMTKIRIRKDQVVETKVFPSVKSLHTALQDGRSLLSIILFYYGNSLQIDDIKLSGILTDTEKLANIELFRSLCAANVCTSVYALRVEDFYYASDQLKNNFLALLCEILLCVEGLGIVMEEKPEEPTLSHAGGTAEARAEHHHQPLLSKRSKKQFAKFESNTHVLGRKAAKIDDLQLDDYELKQSHIVPAIHGEEKRTTPITSSIAWTDTKKPSKISLDFKPSVSSSTRPSIKGVSTDVSTGDNTEQDIPSYRDQPDIVSSHYNEHKSQANLEHEPIPNPHGSSIPHQSFTNNLVTSGPELTGSHKMTSMYQLMSEPDLSSIEVPRDLVVPETILESPVTSEKEVVDDEDEDALSTITETSEPGTPGVVVPALLSSVQQSELSPQHQSPTHANPMEPIAASYVIQEGGTVENAIVSGLPIISARQTDTFIEAGDAVETDRVKYVDLTSSHEVSGMEKEEKILETFLDRDTVEVLDNFMQRTSVKIEETHEEEQENIIKSSLVPTPTVSYQCERPNSTTASLDITNFDAVSTVDDKAPKFGHPPSKGLSKSYEPNTNFEAFFDMSNINKSYSVGQHVDMPAEEVAFAKSDAVIKEPKEPNKSESLSPDTNMKNSLNIGLGSSQELLETSKAPALGSVTEDSNIRLSTKIRSSVSQTSIGNSDPRFSVDADAAKREGELVSGSQDERKAKFFESLNISYEHWPFTKKNQTNKKLIQKNGENMYIEQLDIFWNNRNSQSSPNLTSWLKSGNEQARLSLEEREERLRKIQERRLQYMGSGITTTWSNISRQHEQQKKLQNDIKSHQDVPLSSRLAALRMQLEEKRRQFEEEKRSKLKEWNEERAQALQNAFFVSFDEKENKDPAVENEEKSRLDVKTSHSTVNKSLSPREYIRQKQLEKTYSSSNSPSQKPTWFVDFSGGVEGSGANKAKTSTEIGEINLNQPHQETLSTAALLNANESPSIVQNNASRQQSITRSADLRTTVQETSQLSLSITDPSHHSSVSHSVEHRYEPITEASLPHPTPENDAVIQPVTSHQDEIAMHDTILVTSTMEDSPSMMVDQLNKELIPDGQALTSNIEDSSIAPNDQPNELIPTQGKPPLVTDEKVVTDHQTPIIPAQRPVPFPEERIDSMYQSDAYDIKENDVSIIPEVTEEMNSLQINERVIEHNDITTPESKTAEQASLVKSTTDPSSPGQGTAFTFTFGDDMSESPGMTPEQLKKRERFIKNRQRQMEEKKAKREAELEKKRKKEEERIRVEGEERLRKEEQQQSLQRAKSAQHTSRKENYHENHTPTPTYQRQSSAGAVARTTSPPFFQERRKPAEAPRRVNNESPNQFAGNSPQLAEGEEKRYAEYTGPAAYQKPSGKSNRKIIQNAISHCCLSGGVNREAKDKCLEAIEKSESQHFLVLFRDPMKFRGVYEYYPETELVTKIYGIGPKTVTSKMTDKFFRYNSGGKAFNALLMKSLSIQCDGMSIKKELWEKKQPPSASKTNTNMRKKFTR